jgi:hypothetical protein
MTIKQDEEFDAQLYLTSSAMMRLKQNFLAVEVVQSQAS